MGAKNWVNERKQMMVFRECALQGLLEIIPARHQDERGYFSEIFRAEQFQNIGGGVHFIQENQSLSGKIGTLRGLHFQTPPFAQAKLMRCIAGAIFDVTVDLRVGSPSYGQWAGVELSAELGNRLWIPHGFAHGFCTLQPDTIVSYKVSEYYSAAHDKGLAWDDADLAIDWPKIADVATLSAKDRVQPKLADLPQYFAISDTNTPDYQGEFAPCG